MKKQNAARIFEITIIHGSTRTVRKIIANAAMQATRIAMDLLPEPTERFAIICKPFQLTQ